MSNRREVVEDDDEMSVVSSASSMEDLDNLETSSVSTEDQSRGGQSRRSATSEANEKRIRESIIKQEEGAVRRARMTVIATTIALTIAVSVSVYYFAAKSDQTSFEIAVGLYLEGIASRIE